jgi:hypothetical protein
MGFNSCITGIENKCFFPSIETICIWGCSTYYESLFVSLWTLTISGRYYTKKFYSGQSQVNRKSYKLSLFCLFMGWDGGGRNLYKEVFESVSETTLDAYLLTLAKPSPVVLLEGLNGQVWNYVDASVRYTRRMDADFSLDELEYYAELATLLDGEKFSSDIIANGLDDISVCDWEN